MNSLHYFPEYLPAGGTSNAVSAPLGTLTLTGLAASLVAAFIISAPMGVVTLTGLAPSIVGVSTAITAPLGSLTLTGLTPTIPASAASGVICKIAPFFSTDTITTPGYQLYKYAVGATSPTADGSHVTANINAIPGQVNGYSAFPACTLDTDGGYRGLIVWDSGGSPSFSVADEIYIPPSVAAASAAAVAAAVWDLARAGHATAGTFGEGVSSVVGSVGSVTGAVGSVAGNVGGNVVGTTGDAASITAVKSVTDKIGTMLEDAGHSPGEARFTAAALVEAPSSSGPSAATIASAVWNEATSGHTTPGTTGAALIAAGSAGDPWTAELESGVFAGDMLRGIAAEAFGKTSIQSLGNGQAIVTFRDVSDSSDIIVGQATNSERTSVTFTP